MSITADVVIIIGLIMGSVTLLTACYVWLRKQVFGLGGGILSLVGVILIGLSLWSNVSIEVSEGTIKAEFDRLERQMNDMAHANEAVTEEVGAMWRVVDTNKDQFIQLTQELQTRRTISQERLDEIREPVLTVPQVDVQKIDSAKALLNPKRYPRPDTSAVQP